MGDQLAPGRTVRFYSGHDGGRGEEPDPKYGIHGLEVAFYFRGEEGAVQFKFYTDWIPWRPRPSLDGIGVARYNHDHSRFNHHLCDMFPMAVDLGYHSPHPMYAGHESPGLCPLIGVECFYDGSGLNAENLLTKLIYDGDEAVWAELEDYYRRIFLEVEDERATND